jgi:hypothetical protein
VWASEDAREGSWRLTEELVGGEAGAATGAGPWAWHIAATISNQVFATRRIRDKSATLLDVRLLRFPSISDDRMGLMEKHASSLGPKGQGSQFPVNRLDNRCRV